MSSLLTAEELDEKKYPVLTQEELRKSDRYFVGQAAVDEVERRIGRELDAVEEHIVKEEGFVVGKYLDDKNIETAGVGQTKAYFNSDFTDVIDNFENEVRNSIPSYDNQPVDVQIALMSAQFRGDLQQSKTFRRLFNEGKYAEAAKEFLNHAEYKERLKNNPAGDGVTRRLENISNTVGKLASQSNAQPDTYTVKEGDWLSKIAAERGLDVGALKRANPGINYDEIKPGQVLQLPISKDTTSVVDQDGTVYEVANVFEDTLDFLEEGYDYTKSQLVRLFS